MDFPIAYLLNLSLKKRIILVISITTFVGFIGYISMINSLINTLQKFQRNEMIFLRNFAALKNKLSLVEVKKPRASNEKLNITALLSNFTQLANRQQITLLTVKPLALHTLSFVGIGNYFQFNKFFNKLSAEYSNLQFSDFLMEKFSTNKNYLKCSAVIDFYL